MVDCFNPPSGCRNQHNRNFQIKKIEEHRSIVNDDGSVQLRFLGLTGVKDHGQHCQPAFITFDNDKTAKFYDISLREIVILQGWTITKMI